MFKINWCLSRRTPSPTVCCLLGFFPPRVISCCRKWATWCLPSGFVWILSEQGVKSCWNLLDLVIFLLQCRSCVKPHVSDYWNTSLTSCFESTRVHFYPTKTSKIRILLWFNLPGYCNRQDEQMYLKNTHCVLSAKTCPAKWVLWFSWGCLPLDWLPWMFVYCYLMEIKTLQQCDRVN